MALAAGSLHKLRMELLLVHAHVAGATEVGIFLLVKVELIRHLRRLGRQFFLGRNVAFYALIFELLVLTRDFKGRRVMIEGQSLREIGRAVTLRTGQLERFFAELFLVDRGVAARERDG